MKRIILLAVCLVPALVYGQQTYTNEDLIKIRVPGAYTNQDLRRLSPLPVQREPAAEVPEVSIPRPARVFFQARYDSLYEARAALLTEIAIEEEKVAFSESAFAGDTSGPGPRLGYRTKAFVLIEELEKRVDLLEAQMEFVAETSRRAGALVERR